MTCKKVFPYGHGTIINMFFLLHPIILKVSIQMFACTKIEESYFLDVYMEDECWTGDHWFYTKTVAIPALIVWGFGLP